MRAANDRFNAQVDGMRHHRHLAQIALGSLFAAVLIVAIASMSFAQ